MTDLREAPEVYHFLDTDRIAGTEKHVLSLAGAQVELGLKVTIVCRSGGVLEAAALRQHVATATLSMMPRLLVKRAMERGYRKASPVVLHGHNGRTVLYCAILGRLFGQTTVATQHFISPRHTRSAGIARTLVRVVHVIANRQMDKFIAISECVRAAMLCRRDCGRDRATVVYNGLPVPTPSSPSRLLELREELGIQQDGRIFVCVARLESEKGIDALISGMRVVVSEVPDSLLLICGDGDLRAKIERQIAELDLQKHVRLLGHRTDATAVIELGNVFVLPSREEAFGLVLLEAMAVGKPVVACRAGGPEEIVGHRETGLLVPSQSPEELATAMVELISDFERQQAFGEAGRERYHNLFTAERMARGTAVVYQEAVADRLCGAR